MKDFPIANSAGGLKGLGCSRKRVEDARFTQGKGNYVDDVKLPGMLFGDFVRSPHAHARIKSIDASAALALPGVVAVLTAKDLEPLGLHWMPTLAGDKQMVLADGKVLFQGQEVAFVVAEDRYVAADASSWSRSTTRICPWSSTRSKSLESDVGAARGSRRARPRARTDRGAITTTSSCGKRATRRRTAQAIDEAEVIAEETIYYHRTHPCPLETCGCVASMDKINGKLTLYGTFQAPHVVRTVASLLSGIDEHNIRVISPISAAASATRWASIPAMSVPSWRAIVTGKPVKWVEDRMENLMSTAFARDYWMKGGSARPGTGKITGLQCHVTADHGAFDACADPTRFPAGFFNICTGSYDIPVALRRWTASIPTRRRAAWPIAVPSA